MKRILAALGIAMLSAACTVVGVRSGTEQPNYTVVETLAENLEIRRYGDRLAVETTVSGGADRDARNTAFRRLFRYITGANETAAEIAMTAPVETAATKSGAGEKIAMTAPVETLAGNGNMRMRFFLPSGLSMATAPRPTSSDVNIVTLPGETLAVLRYTGSADADDVSGKKIELADALKASSWRAKADAIAYFYDPPWTLPFMRRNEVAISVEAAQQ